jgi:prepilin-type N-terminal cleavage/methylation domain-containing protein
MISPLTASRHNRESGFTLIELMAVIALIAILALMAITDITQQLQQSETASAVRTLYSAWADLSFTAVATDGATLERRGPSLVLISGPTIPGAGLQTSWSLPESTKISLNGKPFDCLSLNGDAMPINTAWCSTSLTSSTVPNFWLSVSGGAYVTAKS